MLPLARHQGLTVREMPEETLVYDLERNKAHCLNRTSALVWKHCDGKTTVERLAARMRDELATPDAVAVVQLALEQLSRRHLLAEEMSPISAEARLSRREALKRLGKKVAVATALLPLIMTVPARTARAQATPCVATFVGGLYTTQTGCKNGKICWVLQVPLPVSPNGFTGNVPGVCR
jgi:hypothetical protein